MERARPNRLSAHDSVFLNWERPEQPMHVAECMVYDGEFSAEEISEMLSDRMHLLPRYRQRVVAAPLGLAHPTWEDDPDFDIHHHVAERDLLKDDDRELSRVCGELFCGLLDRERPLWHLTVLHGYRGGTVVFLKLHHSMVDGVSSIELIEILHATERGAAVPTRPHEPWQPAPTPGAVDRLRDLVADEAAAALDNVRAVTDGLRPGTVSGWLKRGATLARTMRDIAPTLLKPLPGTPFNVPIGPRRDVAWVVLDMADVTEVRRRLDGSVNDLVLAVLAGALGRYMRRHGDTIEGRTLYALCPVSVRRADQSGAFGNLISMVLAPLEVGEPDPARRFTSTRDRMRQLKNTGQASGIYEMIASAQYVPAVIYRAMWKMWPRGYFPLHITSTNVAGPRQPLFLGEHELVHWYPFGVQWTNNALFLCTLSYRGELILGPVSDPAVVDVWEFAQDLQDAYDELRRAALPRSRSRRSAARAAAK